MLGLSVPRYCCQHQTLTCGPAAMLFTDRAAHPKVLLPSLLHCPTVPLRVRVQLSAPRKGPKATCCADGGAPVCSTPRGSRARGDRGGGQRACRQHEQRGQGAGLQQARAQGQPRRLQAHHPQDAADARRLPAALHQQSLHHSWPRCVHALKRVAPTTLKVIKSCCYVTIWSTRRFCLPVHFNMAIGRLSKCGKNSFEILCVQIKRVGGCSYAHCLRQYKTFLLVIQGV